MRELVLDIWHGNRSIDLAAWKSRHGLWGVIVKFGGHEYLKDERGVLQTFKTFYEDSAHDLLYERVVGLSLHVGAYYYGSATTPEEALREADHFIEILGGRFMDLPVYYDVEERAQLDLNIPTLTSIVTAFCRRVEGAGYTAGIYSGYEGFNNMYHDQLGGIALWVAAWRYSWPIWAKDYGMWQQGSMRLSDGDIQYDDVRGYVDCNWCQIDYPAIGGSGVGKINPANVAALIHYDMVTDPRNGYNQQPVRWGGNHPDGVKVLDIDGRRYEYPLGDYDCSSSVITAWRQALRYTKYEGLLKDATYTGDMRNAFCGTGLFRAAYSPAKRGDLYLAEEKHTAMCQDGGGDGVYGRDCLTEFNRNENHAASYGQVGDQDGYESVFRNYYDDGWNTILHYTGGLLDDVTQKDEKPREDNVGPVFVKLDGDNTEHIFNPWAGTLRAVANADEKKGVTDLYALAGVKVPQEPKALGTEEAPLGARANDALSRGANFKGFDRWDKHPSVRAIIREEIGKALEKTPIAKLVRDE